MRINGFRCDGCGEEHLIDPTRIDVHIYDALPDSWFVVSRGKPKHDEQPFLFCSKECLHRHPLTYDPREYDR